MLRGFRVLGCGQDLCFMLWAFRFWVLGRRPFAAGISGAWCRRGLRVLLLVGMCAIGALASRKLIEKIGFLHIVIYEIIRYPQDPILLITKASFLRTERAGTLPRTPGSGLAPSPGASRETSPKKQEKESCPRSPKPETLNPKP